VKASHDEHLAIGFDLADGLRGESSFSGRDPARFQRAAKRPGQSPGGCGHQIIERRRMRLVNARINAVMRRD